LAQLLRRPEIVPEDFGAVVRESSPKFLEEIDALSGSRDATQNHASTNDVSFRSRGAGEESAPQLLRSAATE